MKGDIVFTEFELLSFDDISIFKEYINDLHEEFILEDIDELILYYRKKSLDLNSFADYLTRFKHEKGL